MNFYLGQEAYDDLVAAVAADMPPDPYDDQRPDYESAKLALGLQAAIWPMAIRADARANGHE